MFLSKFNWPRTSQGNSLSKNMSKLFIACESSQWHPEGQKALCSVYPLSRGVEHAHEIIIAVTRVPTRVPTLAPAQPHLADTDC